MSAVPPATPAFGQADLSNCEREPIHLAAGIQPHGSLLVVREPDLVVVQASANAASELGLPAPLLGRGLDSLPGDLADGLRPLLEHALDEIPAPLRCRLGEPAVDFDALVHRPPAGGVVLELERSVASPDLSEEVGSALEAIRTAASVQDLCDEVARIYRGIAAYDRAMVYRFDEEGHGEVLSERRNPKLDSFLGQRYPASDIPQIARHLYIRNRVRILSDVRHERVPLEPRLSPATSEDLDMSLCWLRAMSPIHIEYLTNMGVRATLVASLVVGGQLWGLVACHHYDARTVPYEVRVAAELIAESAATRIAALEGFAQAQAELSVRRLEQRIAEVVSREGDWRHALFDESRSLLQPLTATGAALIFEGEVRTTGEVPGTPELREIAAWLDDQPRSPVFSTASLGSDEPRFSGLDAVASGLVAAPVSNSPGEYLLWFRPAQVRTLVWGGNPFKPFAVGEDSGDLSPRRSFAKWHQEVQGTSEDWTPAELAAARLVGETVADIVLQFRSVQVLIAQDQLESVRRQVERSQHPVLIADASGKILLGNEACARLLADGGAAPDRIADLPQMFSQRAELSSLLGDMVARRRSFRGEFDFTAEDGSVRPLAVRGDPVLASPGRVLGFVVLVTDLSERRAAEDARRTFQDDLMAARQHDPWPRGRDAAYRKLLSAILGNAQLAALEITEGIDAKRMPGMLASIRDSVDRTTELLDRLSARADPSRRGRR